MVGDGGVEPLCRFPPRIWAPNVQSGRRDIPIIIIILKLVSINAFKTWSIRAVAAHVRGVDVLTISTGAFVNFLVVKTHLDTFRGVEVERAAELQSASTGGEPGLRDACPP